MREREREKGKERDREGDRVREINTGEVAEEKQCSNVRIRLNNSTSDVPH